MFFSWKLHGHGHGHGHGCTRQEAATRGKFGSRVGIRIFLVISLATLFVPCMPSAACILPCGNCAPTKFFELTCRVLIP